jgi:hypothetical protein
LFRFVEIHGFADPRFNCALFDKSCEFYQVSGIASHNYLDSTNSNTLRRPFIDRLNRGGKHSASLNQIMERASVSPPTRSTTASTPLEALRFELREIGVRVKLIEPGIIYTNFANAMEFNNDESLAVYQALMQKFRATMEELWKNGTEVAVAADTIYEAATDGSDRLRYLVGEDAKTWATMLAGMDGEQYFANMSAMFGL